MSGPLGAENPTAVEDSLIQTAIRPGMAKAHAVTGTQFRGQHPKAHGVVAATFQVHEVPAAFRHGIFATPGSYSALIRFSNGGKLNDLEPDAHGMAIKLDGVPGLKLMDDEAAATVQDFILADHPVFFARDVADFLRFLKLKGELGAEEKAAVEAKKSAADLTALRQQQFKRLVEAFPAFDGFLKPPPASPLVATYWSQTPYRLGNGAVKYVAKPAAANASTTTPPPSEHGLRIALTQHLTAEKRPAVFEFCLEVQSDAEKMPIEDATVPWPSPEVIVAATITIPPQEFSAPEQVASGEALSFNPWHALPDHRPLGGINRTRQNVYVDSSTKRHLVTGQPVAGRPPR